MEFSLEPLYLLEWPRAIFETAGSGDVSICGHYPTPARHGMLASCSAPGCGREDHARHRDAGMCRLSRMLLATARAGDRSLERSTLEAPLARSVFLRLEYSRLS
jgi:hypothetical protein